MKALKTMTSGSTSVATAMTVMFVALFLLGVTFASGYIVGAVSHAPRRPTIEWPLPCTRWGFMRPTPHSQPDDPDGCKSLRTDL